MFEEAVKSKEVNDGGFLDRSIVSLDDRIFCYIDYSRALKATNDFANLKRVISDAEQKFQGIPRSFHFTMFKSDLYLEQNELKKALKVFSDIHAVSDL